MIHWKNMSNTRHFRQQGSSAICVSCSISKTSKTHSSVCYACQFSTLGEGVCNSSVDGGSRIRRQRGKIGNHQGLRQNHVICTYQRCRSSKIRAGYSQRRSRDFHHMDYLERPRSKLASTGMTVILLIISMILSLGLSSAFAFSFGSQVSDLVHRNNGQHTSTRRRWKIWDNSATLEEVPMRRISSGIFNRKRMSPPLSAHNVQTRDDDSSHHHQRTWYATSEIIHHEDRHWSKLFSASRSTSANDLSNNDDISNTNKAGDHKRKRREEGKKEPKRFTRTEKLLRNIKRCQTVQQVQQLLEPSLEIEIKKERSNGTFTSADKVLAPHVAAVALRKVADLRSIAAAKERQRRREWNRNQERGSATGNEKVTDMEALNADIRATDAEIGTNYIGMLNKETKSTRSLLSELIGLVGRAILSDTRSLLAVSSGTSSDDESSSKAIEEKEREMHPLALLDTLYALGKLSDNRRRVADSTVSVATGSFQPLAAMTCQAIQSHDEGRAYTGELYYSSLVETVQSMAQLDIREDDALLNTIGNRLEKGDACGALGGRDLVKVIWSYAVLNRPHFGLSRAIMRRLRKQKVRSQLYASDIAKALWSSARLTEQLENTYHDGMSTSSSAELDVSAAKLRNEAETLLYTLSEDLLCPINDKSSNPKLATLTAGQVADIFAAFVTFELDPSSSVISSALLSHIRQASVLQWASCENVARILLACQRLGLCSELNTAVVLGNRFSKAANEKTNPKTLNTALRSLALLFDPKDSSANPCFDAGTTLILDDAYLKQCNEFEVSNLCWSFAQARRVDKRVMLQLANRMMENDIIAQCSPSSVSRMLWSYTTLLSIFETDGNETEDDETISNLRDTLFQLFSELSGVLLSARLTAVDCSSSMYAMARASYPLDMSVFDHLSATLVDNRNLSYAKTRHVASALWACGRIFDWERMHKSAYGKGRKKQKKPKPPYLQNSKVFALNLLSRRDEMSPRDLAQTIWAIGRMNLLADKADEFAFLAAENVMELNGIEIASILSGLSRLGYDNKDFIGRMTDAFARPSILGLASPREISSTMFSLAVMDYRDPKLFSTLSAAMMEKIDEANSDSIQLCLSAYEALNIAPPRVLFDRWASEKLGILGRHSYISAVVGDALASPFGSFDDDENETEIDADIGLLEE